MTDELGEYEDDGEDRWDSAFYEADLGEQPHKKPRGAGGKQEQKSKVETPGKLASLFSSLLFHNQTCPPFSITILTMTGTKRVSAPKTVSAVEMSNTGIGAAKKTGGVGTATAEKTALADLGDITNDPDLKSLLQNPLADGINAHHATPALVHMNSSTPTTSKAQSTPIKQKRGGSFSTPKKNKSTVQYTEVGGQQKEKTSVCADKKQKGVEEEEQQPMVDSADVAVVDHVTTALQTENKTTEMKAEIPSTEGTTKQLEEGTQEKSSVIAPSSGAAPHCGEKVPLDKNGNLSFFWIDAAEYVTPSQPGSVYVFGKVLLPSKDYASCCMVVRNVPKVAFAVPREPVLDSEGKPTEYCMAVMEELQTLKERYRLGTMRCKPVFRNYAFDIEDVPFGSSSYIKMKIEGPVNRLPKDVSGKTFSHLIGLSSGPLEQLILKCKLMGPSWLLIKHPRVHTALTSWCAMEVSVDNYKDIEHIEGGPAVPMTLMGLAFKTVINSERHETEIVTATLCCQRNANIDDAEKTSGSQTIKFSAVRRLDKPLPLDFTRDKNVSGHVTLCNTNREMLNFIFTTIGAMDPDVFIGHNIIGYDLDVLLHLAKKANDNNWSKLGRLRLSSLGTNQRYMSPITACRGRLICDTYVLAQELVKKQKSYRLVELAETQLGEPGHTAMEPAEVPNQFISAASLKSLVAQNERDARLAMRIADQMKMVSLTKQLTSLAGNLWARTLAGHRAERIEYLLLHEFHKLKFVVPEKRTPGSFGSGDGNGDGATAKRKKAAYKGGMVLDAKVGFYDKMVVLLDFKSLYPSLIQEFNVCFTTVKRSENTDPKSAIKWTATEPDPGTPEGILPRVLRTLVRQRRTVREQMNKESNKAVVAALNIRQSALKLIANSLYGCLGFEYSRFYARPLAELVTRKGRETLEKSMGIAEKWGLTVIYGDTDSLMLNTGCDTVENAKEQGMKVLRAINKEYHALEIDLEAVFNRLLLLKKKNYACLNAESGKREVKGIHVVRRDWCDLSKEAGNFVLDQLLTTTVSRDEVPERIYTYLTDLTAQMKAGTVPIEKFGITKLLSKDPAQYGDVKSQPHAQAALRFRAEGGKVGVGDFITYIICKAPKDTTTESSDEQKGVSSGENSAVQHAYVLDSVRKNPSLQINVEWYLSTQLFPPLMRLCTPLPDIDIPHLAECLGLDPTKHISIHRDGGSTGYTQSMDDDDASSVVENANEFASKALLVLHKDAFDTCEEFLVRCPYSCCSGQTPFVFKGLLYPVEPGGSYPSSALHCPRCHKPFGAISIGNQAVQFIRKLIRQLYLGSCVCENETCRHITRTPVLHNKALANGTVCQVLRCPLCKSNVTSMYDESALYYQLVQLHNMFDTTVEREFSANLTTDQRDFFDAVAQRINPFIQQCSLHYVSLSSLLV